MTHFNFLEKTSGVDLSAAFPEFTLSGNVNGVSISDWGVTRNNSSYSGNGYYLYDIGTPDMRIVAKNNAPKGYFSNVFVFRTIDLDNRWELFMETGADEYKLKLRKFVASVGSVVWTSPTDIIQLHQDFMVVTDGDDIMIYVDGVLQTTVTDPDLNTATKAGIFRLGSQVDNANHITSLTIDKADLRLNAFDYETPRQLGGVLSSSLFPGSTYPTTISIDTVSLTIGEGLVIPPLVDGETIPLPGYRRVVMTFGADTLIDYFKIAPPAGHKYVVLEAPLNTANTGILNGFAVPAVAGGYLFYETAGNTYIDKHGNISTRRRGEFSVYYVHPTTRIVEEYLVTAVSGTVATTFLMRRNGSNQLVSNTLGVLWAKQVVEEFDGINNDTLLGQLTYIQHTHGTLSYSSVVNARGFPGKKALRHNLNTEFTGNDPLTGKPANCLYGHTFLVSNFHTPAQDTGVQLVQRYRLDNSYWDTQAGTYPLVSGKLLIEDITVSHLSAYLELVNDTTVRIISGNDSANNQTWSSAANGGWCNRSYGWRGTSDQVVNFFDFDTPKSVFRSDGKLRELTFEVKYNPAGIGHHLMKILIDGEALLDSDDVNTDSEGWFVMPIEFGFKGTRFLTAVTDFNVSEDFVSSPINYSGYAGGVEVLHYAVYTTTY